MRLSEEVLSLPVVRYGRIVLPVEQKIPGRLPHLKALGIRVRQGNESDLVHGDEPFDPHLG